MNTKAACAVEQDVKLRGRRHRGRDRERGGQGRHEVPDHDGNLQRAFERQMVEELQKLTPFELQTQVPLGTPPDERVAGCMSFLIYVQN